MLEQSPYQTSAESVLKYFPDAYEHLDHEITSIVNENSGITKTLIISLLELGFIIEQIRPLINKWKENNETEPMSLIKFATTSC